MENKKYFEITGAYERHRADFEIVESFNTLSECIRLITTLITDKENCYSYYLVTFTPTGAVVLDVEDWMLRA